jgi:RNA recognition motif-containing protein
MNIYVGNLPSTVTDDEIKEIFSEYGEVHSAKIILDRDTNKPRGFGFVEMSETAARKAITALNGAELEGKELVVNEARAKKQGFGGGDRNRRRSW